MLTMNGAMEIMRLTDAVYESDVMPFDQDVDVAQTVQNSQKPKRYVRFVCQDVHQKGQRALNAHLTTLGNGNAVLVGALVERDGRHMFVKDSVRGDGRLAPVVFVDMTRVSNEDERRALKNLIANTLIKMDQQHLDLEIYNMTAAHRDNLGRMAVLTMENQKNKKRVAAMQAGIEQIQEASKKTKPGLGSRQVNALKKVIDSVADNTK